MLRIVARCIRVPNTGVLDGSSKLAASPCCLERLVTTTLQVLRHLEVVEPLVTSHKAGRPQAWLMMADTLWVVDDTHSRHNWREDRAVGYVLSADLSNECCQKDVRRVGIAP